MATDVVTDPIRIFCGADCGDGDLEFMSVFEFTLARHCSRPYELRWMRLNNDPTSPWRHSLWSTSSFSTPFTSFRFGVPAACEYEGKAIYCDVDTWWQRDPAELWDQQHNGAALMAAGNYGKPSYGVLFWDCVAARGHIQSKPHKPDFMGANTAYFRAAGAPVVKVWDGDWNCLDGGKYDSIDDPRIGLVHCTRMGTQPIHRHAGPRLKALGQKHWYDGAISPHPRQDVQDKFDSLLRASIAAGFTLDRYKSKGPPIKYSKKSYRGK